MRAKDLLNHATEFTFFPEGAEADEINGLHHAIRVAQRSPGRWAVIHQFQCWDGKEWVPERSPSSRTDKFKKKSRFPLKKAVKIALEQVDKAKVNGKTYAEWETYFKILKEHEQLLAEQDKLICEGA